MTLTSRQIGDGPSELTRLRREIEQMRAAAQRLMSRADCVIYNDAKGNGFRKVFADDLRQLHEALEQGAPERTGPPYDAAYEQNHKRRR